MDKKFYINGLQFECTGCGYCCGHEPGYVFLSEKDLNDLCLATGYEKDAFLLGYCVEVNMGFDLLYSLKEKENHDCIFYTQENGCEVYSARPLQCRTYPFWSSVLESKKTWEEEACFCPGINKGKYFSKEEINKKLMARENAILKRKKIH